MAKKIIALYLRLLAMLDREQVLAFQGMYYVLFCLGGIAMLLVPGVDAAAGQVYLMLGPKSYIAWALIVTLCPPITLVGRRLMSHALRLPPGAPTPAWGAAWLQFTGDLGVWGAIDIFAWELWSFDHQWWSENLFLFLFLIMGVLGGFMFTFRSVRRLVAVKRTVRLSEKAEA